METATRVNGKGSLIIKIGSETGSEMVGQRECVFVWDRKTTSRLVGLSWMSKQKK
ncbi:hypothetical protein RhiirA5_364857 [Rhizophagus irregularis]|uniref:Uncharacterized protein n=1 Tax=Rhizophagus irregularis TaxID=588596 RepID=A0A2N0P3Z0_9GLOM|nr:hypothetical protein RhiirA5_364857 [Rhizophagus irregularis]